MCCNFLFVLPHPPTPSPMSHVVPSSTSHFHARDLGSAMVIRLEIRHQCQSVRHPPVRFVVCSVRQNNSCLVLLFNVASREGEKAVVSDKTTLVWTLVRYTAFCPPRGACADAERDDAVEGEEERCNIQSTFETSKYNSCNIRLKTVETLENYCNHTQTSK